MADATVTNLSRPGRTSAAGRGVTIRDVALAAGVSVATVSKALNGRGRLREETRAHVAAVARGLNFRPNDLAQSLHRGRSFTVGVLSNDLYGRFALPIIAGIEAALARRQVCVFLCNAADDPANERRHLDSLLGKRVDGLILTGRRTDRRFAIPPAEVGVPVLHVYARGVDEAASCLLPDDEAGGRLATRHLLALGRRRIAHVTGPDGFEAVGARREGHRAALREAGIEPDPGLEMSGEWSEAWGREAAARLFGRPGSRRSPARSATRPDAVFCGNDLIARGLADALRERGLDVPGDVGIVGFDNWEIMAAATRPPLTTVDPDLAGLGRIAGTRLLDAVDGTPLVPGVERVPGRLVVRGSCGAAADLARLGGAAA